MITQPADVWRALLRRSMLTARKERDSVRVSALRSVLSAIDNAEAPDAIEVDARQCGEIAGAVDGLGATEVVRRQLSDEHIRGLVRSEIEERLTAADEIAAGGFSERAASVRAEAAVLAGLLGDV